MKLQLLPSATSGTVKAIASKSVAHRLLICAAFADADTVVRCEEVNRDIEATVRCLQALGATVIRQGADYRVSPIGKPPKTAVLDCGESGSTLRFFVPITCMLGIDSSFRMEGRLPQRPLSPLRERLEEAGISFSKIGSNPLRAEGTLNRTDFSIPGNVSSQFISGLLFALACSGKGGSVTVEGALESAPCVDMTLDALRLFGIRATRTDSLIRVHKSASLSSPRTLSVEGDWSGAAFPLCLGAIGSGAISVTGLSLTSRQGDRAILSLLRRFGAEVTEEANCVTVSPTPLRGISIDASQIPDLVPILAVVASVAEGRTEIRGAARLRIKESDRLTAVRQLLSHLGARIIEHEDGLTIDGVSRLRGGTVSAFGDHRIAMSAAVASAVCDAPLWIEGAEAVEKSYPSFWNTMNVLGMSPQINENF